MKKINDQHRKILNQIKYIQSSLTDLNNLLPQNYFFISKFLEINSIFAVLAKEIGNHFLEEFKNNG